MPKPPVPLKSGDQATYDELYSLFGKAEADEFAQGVADVDKQRAIVPSAPAPTAAPVTSTPSPVSAPVAPFQLVPGPDGRLRAVPVGMEPRAATPPMGDIKISAPSREELVKMGLGASEMYKKRRVTELMATGLGMTEAEEQATREATRTMTIPRTTEFSAAKVPGYSELAVRGQELLPRMSATEATLEALKPQVLETQEQAEGRRRFDAEMRAAKQRLQDRAKAAGQTVKQQVDLELIGNDVKAGQIAYSMYPTPTRAQISDIRAALNAPLYAAVEELKGTPPDEILSKFGKDALRGLTMEERYGRLVETKGAAALRNIGGLSRYAIRGAEEALVKPVIAGVVSALDPNITYTQLMQSEDAAREAGGGVRAVPPKPGVKYEKGAQARQKLDTGDFLRDTAYEVATGRSAVDDYIDAGVPSGVATVLGIATEFAIPVTPIGWATDVAPAFAGVARAAGAGRAMDAIAASRVGAGARLVAEAPEIIRLRSFAKAQGGRIADAVAESPTFARRLSDATSLRKNLTEIMVREGADVGQLEKLVNAGADVANGERIGATMLHLGTSARAGGKFANDVISGLKALPDYEEFLRLVKPVAYGVDDIDIIDAAGELIGKNIKLERLEPAARRFLQQADELIQAKARQAGQVMRESKVPATRVSYVAGTELGPLKGAKPRNFQPAREAVAAEVVDAIPTDNYVFLTNNMMVNKSLLNNPELKQIIKTATESISANRSFQEVEKAVEDAVRAKFSGDVATPMGVATPRSPQFFDTARGGIERLQQPVSRRLVAVETVEDVVTTVKSALGKKSWTQTVDSFEAAAKGRLTPDVARFMTDTKGQLDSVALNLESAMGRLKASGVDDPIEAYVEARLAAIEFAGRTGRGINVSVFNPRFLEIVRDGRVMGQTSDAGKADVAADIVTFRLEASNLRAVLGEDWKKVVVKTANENVRATATQTYQATLDALRAKYPDFQSVGLGRRGVVGKIAGGEANNDVLATVQWIASEEARTVFKNGVRKHFGNMAGDADEVEAITRRATAESDIIVGTSNVKANVQRAIDEWFDTVGKEAVHSRFSKAADDLAADFIYNKDFTRPLDDVVEDFSDLRAGIERAMRGEAGPTPIRRSVEDQIDTLKAQRDDEIFRTRELMRGQAKQQIDDAVDDITTAYAARIADVREEEVIRVADVTPEIKAAAQKVVRDYIAQATRSRLLTLDSRFSKQFALSGFDERVAIETLSNLVDLPLPTALKDVLVKYFGSIDELKKMTGIIGDQATLGNRSIQAGMGTKFWEATTQLADTFRGINSAGLTAGTALPNVRYHGVNFITAPLIQAFTSPKFLLETAAQGYLNIPLRGKLRLGSSVNPALIRSGRLKPDEFAMTTVNGITYTYGDLNKMLDELYFGMTEQNYLLGGRQLEDIGIAAKAPPGVIKQDTDTIIRSLGFKGTGYWSRFASSIDRQWRQTAFLVALRNGQTPDQALSIAKNAFLDYGKIPDGVRQSVGKYMQFFSWFALSNAEWVRAFLTSSGGSNIAKIATAQRDAHRQWGDWMFEDDATKKRLWSSFIGNFDGSPAFDVGPENPAVGALFDTAGPMAVSLYMAGADPDFSAANSFDDLTTIFIDKASGPIINYLKQVGAIGDRPLGDVVPARSVSINMQMGPEHFAEWIDQNGITPIPYDKRRPGTETFYGEQFMFTNDAAKKRWARSELLWSLTGLSRFASDAQQIAVMSGYTPPGMDAKRFENAGPLDILKYFIGGTKVKGRDEYDAYRNATKQIIRELSTGEGATREVTE